MKLYILGCVLIDQALSHALVRLFLTNSEGIIQLPEEARVQRTLGICSLSHAVCTAEPRLSLFVHLFHKPVLRVVNVTQRAGQEEYKDE